MVTFETLPTVIAAFLLSTLGVYLGMRLAPYSGAIAQVQPDRWHTRGAVPKLAGPGIAAGLFVALPLDQWMVAVLACLIGVLDDHRRLGPAVKALLLLAPASAAVYVTGLWWTGPAVWLGANSFNLLDHADGVAAATALAVLMFGGVAEGHVAAAAIAGFLVFNFPPARTFMGDGGSLLIGTTLVLVAAKTGPTQTVIWLLIPLMDTTLVVISRLRAGQKPWIGGTDHSGHRLLRYGVPVRLLPLLYFSVAGAIALTSN